MSIEEDVKRCKELIKIEHASWIGLSNQKAITGVLARIKELEEENTQLEAIKDEAIRRYNFETILKQKVIDKININNNIMLETKNKYPSTYTALDEWRNAKAQNEVLEEILEEK